MSLSAQTLHERLSQATALEQELVLRFLLGKRTAEMGRASPQLDLYLAELQVELPGAIELLGDFRFHLGDELHGEVWQWAQGMVPAAQLYARIVRRFETLFLQ